MNAVEIEEAITVLADQEFAAEAFPFAFLEAFGNKETTLKRLKSGSTNASDIDGGVLQRNNIHIAVCVAGKVTDTLGKLKTSPATNKAKAKFILATDGVALEAEDLTSGETVACEYKDFPNHFGFFLPLAGITTVKQIRNNPIDIQATGRLNRLYVELLKDNEAWATDAGRHNMNQFMTRLIFCFFAEDTDIFEGDNLFTGTIEQMSDSRSENTQQVIGELFRAMDTKPEDRAAANLPRWAAVFPYVNGGLFAGTKEIPRFSRIARSYLLHVGKLDWKAINPDIFGSMIQAVADDEERGELGMHYTSVPNILKVLNPLFLDDLREQLEQAGDNARKLLNLRKRIANIRVFDPACGSGNFLVIAYIQLREIEAEILRRRGEANDSGFVNQKSWIRLENFYGIEIKDFAVEVARLSLLIAEFQCDVRMLGQKQATALVLPLKKTGQIQQGNALRLDWLKVCPPTQAIEGEAVETYICGNPPYLGSQDQSSGQKQDLTIAFGGAIKSTKSADYVSGWFIKARQYVAQHNGVFAFVATNSICQGRQVALFWPTFLGDDLEIQFAVPSFLWSNLASKKAAVIVSIIGIGAISKKLKLLFDSGHVLATRYIGPYLVPDHDTVVSSSRKILSDLLPMTNGSMPNDGGGLLLSVEEWRLLINKYPDAEKFCRRFLGSNDSIQGDMRYCLWVSDHEVDTAKTIPDIAHRIEKVRAHRLESSRSETNALAQVAHAFGERRHQTGTALLIPRHSSVSRPYLPSILVDDLTIIGDSAIALYGVRLLDFSIFSSRMHIVWAATVCGRIKEDYRYSNTLGWNTFPVPVLTEKNKADLTRCAEDILLAREAHFPATIADLYDPENMPENLRQAHERNDEVLERIYIGRRFKNDTERLEKLFDLYTKMTGEQK